MSIKALKFSLQVESSGNPRGNRVKESTIDQSRLTVMCSDDTRGNITNLLNDIREGNKAAEDLVFPILYAELHRQAVHFMRSERPDHTLQPTALVHEAYLRIFEGEVPEWNSRAAFGFGGSSAKKASPSAAEAFLVPSDLVAWNDNRSSRPCEEPSCNPAHSRV